MLSDLLLPFWWLPCPPSDSSEVPLKEACLFSYFPLILGQSSPCVFHFTQPALADLPEHLPRPICAGTFTPQHLQVSPWGYVALKFPYFSCLTPSYSPLRFRPYPLLTFPLLLSFVHNSHVCVSSVMSNSLRLPGLQPARLLCPWNHPHKNAGVGCQLLLLGGSSQPLGTEPISLASPALANWFYITAPPGKPPFLTCWDIFSYYNRLQIPQVKRIFLNENYILRA